MHPAGSEAKVRKLLGSQFGSSCRSFHPFILSSFGDISTLCLLALLTAYLNHNCLFSIDLERFNLREHVLAQYGESSEEFGQVLTQGLGGPGQGDFIS